MARMMLHASVRHHSRCDGEKQSADTLRGRSRGEKTTANSDLALAA